MKRRIEMDRRFGKWRKDDDMQETITRLAREFANIRWIPEEKVWMVFIDIHILDYDGNLFDAASLASLAALMTTMVPAKRFELGDDYPLPIKEPPISCTSVKFNDIVVMDPSLDEEEIAEVRLTVATDKNEDIRAMQKGLNGSFTREEIKKVIKASIDNGKKIREQLYKSIGK